MKTTSTTTPITTSTSTTHYLVRSLLLLTLLLTTIASLVSADEKTHRYEVGEKVIVWANHVGPHYNPQETYGYYTLPFCKPEKLHYKNPSLGEALQGMELVKSSISLVFRGMCVCLCERAC